MPHPVSELKKAVASQRKLPVWVAHMWQRIEKRRLGLILGAGISIDAGCPTWSVLVKRISQRAGKGLKDAMKAHRKAKIQETYITQILFLLHREKIKGIPPKLPAPFETYQIKSTWMEIVHKHLYKDLSSQTFAEISARHPYLGALGELICRAGLTVNFNFDDLVDEAAIDFAKSRNKAQPEIIYRPKIETRDGAPVIYHINGYLPREPRRRRSDFLTFTEDAFADVLISPHSLDAEFIMSRFSTTTFLLLGTSLNDNSLKNMLRAGRKRNAANHHYIVYWEDASLPRSDDERRHLFEVNLEVYNLISLFLSSPQIAELIQLLDETEEGTFESDLLRTLYGEDTPSILSGWFGGGWKI